MFAVRHDYGLAECGLSFWATLVLTLLAVTSLVLRYVTNPISCFVPAQFEDSQWDYANQICFHTSSIYSVEAPDSPGDSPGEYQGQSLFTYHQWLPFFLGLAAMMCLLPHVIWRMLTASFLWLDLHPFTAALSANGSAADRRVTLRDSALLLQAGFKGGNSVLAVTAVLRKGLVCAVCFVQMLLMVLVFQPRLGGGGGEEEVDGEGEGGEGSSGLTGFVAEGNGSVPLPVHPFRCHFDIWSIHNVHRYQVICLLTVTQVYSKALVFLMLFFLILFLLCVLDLTYCALLLLIPRLKDATLTRFLALSSQSGGRADSSGPAQLSRFLDSLGRDGRWVVSVVSEHCGPLTAAQLTQHLMQVFLDSPHSSPPSPSGDAGAVPMVTIGASDGDAATEDGEKGKVC